MMKEYFNIICILILYIKKNSTFLNLKFEFISDHVTITDLGHTSTASIAVTEEGKFWNKINCKIFIYKK